MVPPTVPGHPEAEAGQVSVSPLRGCTPAVLQGLLAGAGGARPESQAPAKPRRRSSGSGLPLARVPCQHRQEEVRHLAVRR